jgi:hypothetical protein
VYAVSDLHGYYEGSVGLLKGNRLIDGDLAHPETMRWTGGTATLVVVGDVVNKGPASIKLIDMLRSIQRSARAIGGTVIVTLGNHEAEFIEQPLSARALRDGKEGRKHGVSFELQSRGVTPESVAAGADEDGRGKWLRELPFAAKVGDTFFVHSGDTGGRTIDEVEAHVRQTVGSGAFGHAGVVGPYSSILGTDDWRRSTVTAAANVQKLGVTRIVMGHFPEAFDAHGDIASTNDGKLVKLDTGFGNAAAPPLMLKISPDGKLVKLDEHGNVGRLARYNALDARESQSDISEP